jgi:hypothetical protein
MRCKTIQRGIVALAVVTSLSAAGSRPAAAMDLGLMRQISDVWSFVTGASSHAARQVAAKPVPRKSSTTTTPPPGEGGWGIDPNGSSLHSLPTILQSGG